MQEPKKRLRSVFFFSYKKFRKEGDGMKPAIIKNKDELPMFLSIKELAALLGISRSSAYELAAEEGFPKLKHIPGRVIIPRDKLFDWLEQQRK
jgi:excisionase family DNA binding protein